MNMESLIEKFDKECNCSDNIESVLAQIQQPKKDAKFLIQLMSQNHSNSKVQWHGLYELMCLAQTKRDLPLILDCVRNFMQTYPKVQRVQHYGCLVLVAMTNYCKGRQDINYELILDLIINAVKNFDTRPKKLDTRGLNTYYQIHREALNTYYNIISYCDYKKGFKIMIKIADKYPDIPLMQTFKNWIIMIKNAPVA